MFRSTQPGKADDGNASNYQEDRGGRFRCGLHRCLIQSDTVEPGLVGGALLRQRRQLNRQVVADDGTRRGRYIGKGEILERAVGHGSIGDLLRGKCDTVGQQAE
jgi:hypothetical protein